MGFGISVTDYAQATQIISTAAERNDSAIVSCHAVHAVVTFSRTKQLRDVVDQFEMVTPDGQPVRWAMNIFQSARLRDRVYGPELMLRLCAHAAERGIRIALLGSTPATLDQLTTRLQQRYPKLEIVEAISPPFAPIDELDLSELAERLTRTGAQLVFIGLGCPKQDLFAHALRPHLAAVQVCVGAAFDLHAGRRPMAPAWMQRNGMEWIFRLSQEPRRLFFRYLVTNTEFIARLFIRALKPRRSRSLQVSSTAPR